MKRKFFWGKQTLTQNKKLTKTHIRTGKKKLQINS